MDKNIFCSSKLGKIYITCGSYYIYMSKAKETGLVSSENILFLLTFTKKTGAKPQERASF